MEATKTQTVTIGLDMSFEEARLLMGLIQNPLSDQEDMSVTQLRQAIWDALESQGVRLI